MITRPPTLGTELLSLAAARSDGLLTDDEFAARRVQTIATWKAIGVAPLVLDGKEEEEEGEEEEVVANDFEKDTLNRAEEVQDTSAGLTYLIPEFPLVEILRDGGNETSRDVRCARGGAS